MRKQKGFEIAQTEKVAMQGYKWLVPSQNTINKKYEVILYLDRQVCNCPDFIERGLKCKHILAVEITITKEISGSETKITQRITYSQDWLNYDKAQTKQKELFMKLLHDLVQTIPEEPKQTGKGRPRLPIRDMAFSSALKVFTTFSLRRFMTDMRMANQLGYVKATPHFSMISYHMEKEELTPILRELITLSALPLKSVETKFAIDSSGFRTTKFNEYCREKHDTKQQHKWLKAHICVGVKTNIITAVEITEGYSNDIKEFVPLTQRTYDNGFKIEEMTGDKAYNSKDNYNAIHELGGTAYIPFKTNASPWGNSSSKGAKAKLWRRMLNYFVYNKDEFMQHYHLRSNVEVTFFMIKSKFTDLIRSKDVIAQKNELLLKVLCHNIVVLIQEMNELGIEPNFLQ